MLPPTPVQVGDNGEYFIPSFNAPERISPTLYLPPFNTIVDVNNVNTVTSTPYSVPACTSNVQSTGFTTYVYSSYPGLQSSYIPSYIPTAVVEDYNENIQQYTSQTISDGPVLANLFLNQDDRPNTPLEIPPLQPIYGCDISSPSSLRLPSEQPQQSQINQSDFSDEEEEGQEIQDSSDSDYVPTPPRKRRRRKSPVLTTTHTPPTLTSQSAVQPSQAEERVQINLSLSTVVDRCISEQLGK